MIERFLSGAGEVLSVVSELVGQADQLTSQARMGGSISPLHDRLDRERLAGLLAPVDGAVRTRLFNVPVLQLDAEKTRNHWNSIHLPVTARWVDIGSGNSDTLGRLARRHKAEFIGVELEDSVPLLIEMVHERARHLCSLPANAKYFVLSWNADGKGPAYERPLTKVSLPRQKFSQSSTDVIRDQTIRCIGTRTADVVSLIFPYTEVSETQGMRRWTRGPKVPILYEQIQTALALLKPGGEGVLFLESSSTSRQKRVLERVLHFLRREPAISKIFVGADGIPASDFDIANYAPTLPSGKPADTQPLERGQMVFFTTKVA